MPRGRQSQPTQSCQPVKAGEGALPREREERLAALAWSLAHPLRVRILQLLARRETCVCGEIVEELPVAQSTVSQHLKILKEAGLVQGEIDGPRVCYCVNAAALAEFKELVDQL
jgi:ArsR family transcriptional regulator, arsenate/arsenite/antimonite-responsive transcriptional repressor